MSNAGSQHTGLKRLYSHSGIYAKRDQNTQNRMLSNVTSSGGVTAKADWRGIHIAGKPFGWQTIPFSLYAITANTVKFKGGKFFVGDNAPVTLADADQNITVDQQYVGIQYNFATGAASWISPTTSEPVSTGQLLKISLALFAFTAATTLQKAKARLVTRGYLGGNVGPFGFFGE